MKVASLLSETNDVPTAASTCQQELNARKQILQSVNINAISAISTVLIRPQALFPPTFEDGQANIPQHAKGQHGTIVTHVTEQGHQAPCSVADSAFSKPRKKHKKEPLCPPFNSSASTLIMASANSPGSGTDNSKRPCPGPHIDYLVNDNLSIWPEEQCPKKEPPCPPPCCPLFNSSASTLITASANSPGSGTCNSKRPHPGPRIDYLVNDNLRIPSEEQCPKTEPPCPPFNSSASTLIVASFSAGSETGNGKRPHLGANIDYLVNDNLSIPSEEDCIAAVDYMESIYAKPAQPGCRGHLSKPPHLCQR